MNISTDLLAHSSRFSPTTQTTARSGGGKKKLIYDQDHRGPLSTDTVATLMLLQADNIDLLGICTVSCDMWAKQETAYALRLLEIMGRPEVPVYMGAQEPLLNTKAEAQMRYQMFGSRTLGNEGYLGCFAKDGGNPRRGGTAAAALRPIRGRSRPSPSPPRTSSSAPFAPIRNEVTMYCGGPMTNLALAAMLAPDIVPITKEVIFMGGGIHHSTSSVNVYFDAEAAKIGFRAGWPKFTLVTTDLAEQVHMAGRRQGGLHRGARALAHRRSVPRLRTEAAARQSAKAVVPHAGRNDGRARH